MSEFFIKIEKQIESILADSPLDFEIVHGEMTLKNVLLLKPDADDALKIAALGHDIDRGVTKITEGTDLKDYGDINQFKKEHAERSAKILREILEENGADKDLVKKVESLVSLHEVGGNYEADILMDADSISYFDYNIYEYHSKNGDEKTKNKIKFMSSRVSPNALKIIKEIKYNDPHITELVAEAIK